jgi:hypothetical protein
MQNGNALPAILCSLAFLVAVNTLIGAFILRAAVSLFNKMSGGPYKPTSVPEPSLGKAMLIIFATSVVNAVMLFAVTSTTPPPDAVGLRPSGVQLTAYLIISPISLLILASMLTATLPTSFGRALLITLCYIVIAILLALTIAAAIALIVVLVAATS